MMDGDNEMAEEFPDMMNGYNIFEEEIPNIRIPGIANENGVSRNLINNRWFIPLIIAISAVIIFNNHYFSSENSFEFVDFDEFVIYYEKLKSEFDPFKLTYCNNSGQQNQSVIELKLNKFCETMEITKSSYAKMYSDGVWFFWEIEQCISSILNHISKKSILSFFINNNERKNSFSNNVQESIKSLETFSSSIEKSYEITSIAESVRNSAHKRVIKAKNDELKLILNCNNKSHWKKFRDYIYSMFDKRDGLKCDTQKGDLLEHLDNDLVRIAKILLNFKGNLKIHSDVLRKLSDNIEYLKHLKLNNLEIQKINNIRKLLSMIKENHKKFNK
ncbi:hypothetical protein RhiirA1_495848 [Rhizophagus irregularis]|uniref:Uncharacterized protein n=4 Tax=Rhizophagus irregularis TaxID=588596 RepID=A0A2I1E1Y2_9GLOM|nr:hypothetical protein RirG_253210 [Rhizophagus irregularis DAOM 197198w]PKC71673.1 hypothetical protein RhiirA1_495848 [Rhizophagus irregularis]GET60145.1 hypothetical protein GLOIN_2v1611044 [Rhizophagus irregularis DAOM 181602=DAOM 197198]PKY16140.1 hypothetical protein RhiirB3_480205 [Rhizophagus irregularis]UZO02137.1 hypothetical protein OCT59_020631 [Rhizophagus irregularis]